MLCSSTCFALVGAVMIAYKRMEGTKSEKGEQPDDIQEKKVVG